MISGVRFHTARLVEDISSAEIAKLRQREATLAAQVASILAPVSVMCRMRPLESCGLSCSAAVHTEDSFLLGRLGAQ